MQTKLSLRRTGLSDHPDAKDWNVCEISPISLTLHLPKLVGFIRTPPEGQDMDEHPTDLAQTDEDILTCDVSDEALEAAACTAQGTIPMTPVVSQRNACINLC
jgi:hypothetical protein